MSSPSRRRTIRFTLSLIISAAVSVGILWGMFTSNAFESAGQAVAPVISATKADALFTDVDGDGRADPGDTLSYTVVIGNTGPDSATSTVFTDTLPNSLTLVPGSVNASPIGFDDSYTATGNVRITVAVGSGVLSNDIDPDTGNNAGLTASAGVASTNGGNVTMNADGSFVYNPAPGFQGTDTFTYTVTDPGGATGTGTVTFNVSGIIWFVNAAAAGGGDGRITSPFNCLVGAGCFDPVAADGAGDNIFLYSGSYTGGLTLLANQRLIGQGATASLSTITGLTPPAGSDALPATGGSRPAVTTSAVSTNGVNVGSGNTLRGFNIGNTTAVDIAGTGVGTLTIADMDLGGTGRLLNLTTGTLAATFGSLGATSAPGGPGVSLTSIGGTLTVTGTTSISGAGTQGISISGSSVAANFGTSTTIGSTTQGILVGTSTGNVSFGNTSITAGTDGVSLQNNSAGTRSFGTLSTTNGSGVGFLHAVGGGTATISGAATFTNPGTNCINIQDSTTAISFQNVTTTQCGAVGVFLDDNTGAITFAKLDISPLANIRAFHATDQSVGTITATSGTIPSTGTATAVEIVGTSAASTTPLNITFTSVSASGGANGIILRNTSGTGFSIIGDNTNTAVGGNGTGGSFSGMSGADGAIAGNAVYLDNAQNVSLRRVSITGINQNHGIRGFSVNNFTLQYSTVGSPTPTVAGSINANLQGSNGAGIGEGAIYFGSQTNGILGVTGTATFTNNNISAGRVDNLQLSNGGGTLDRLNITGSTFGLNHLNGNAALTVVARRASSGNTVLNSTVTGNTFTGSPGNAANFTGQEPSTTLGIAMDTVFQNNNITNNHSGNVIGGSNLTIAGFSNNTFNVSNNTMSGAHGSAITLQLGAPGFGSAVATSLTGTLNNNVIGVAATPNSGSVTGNGIFFSFADNTTSPKGQVTLALTNNQIHRYSGNAAIYADNTGGNYNVDLTVTGNTADTPGAGAFAGYAMAAGAPSSADDIDICAQLGGAGPLANNFSTGDPANLNDIILGVSTGASSMRLVGAPAGPFANLAAVESYVFSQNNFAGTVVFAYVDAPATAANFTGGATPCVQPSTLAERNADGNLAVTGHNNNLSFWNGSYSRAASFSYFTDTHASESGVAPSELSALAAGFVADFLIEQESTGTEVDAIPTLAEVNEDPSMMIALLKRLAEMVSPTAYSQETTGDEKELDSKVPESGETITVNGSGTGFTIPSNKSTTITFRAVIGNALPAVTTVSNQGSVSGNFTTVLTDDPDVAGQQATVTNIDHTTVAVASSGSPSVFGQTVTFTATMTGVPARTSDPPGNVQFKADGINIGAAVPVVIGTANDNVSTAQASISTLAVGTRVITAEYSGGGSGATGYNANIGTLAGGQVVGKANTTTGLTSSQNPSVFGQAVTFTATINVTPPGTGTPTGTINFLDGGNPIVGCQNVALQSAQAQCQPGSLAVGSHTITTTYSGDASFNTSSGTMTGNPQVVNKANTSVALASSQNPAPQGTTITFTATVSVTAPGAGAPSGTVQFRDGVTPITGCTAVTVTANSAACMTNALAPGNRTISAVYSGDGNFNTSTGNLTGNPQVITGPPVLIPTAGLTRVQGNPASNSVIATVSDDVSTPGAIAVTAQNVPTGMQVTNIVNTNGSISADVRALCNATTGSNTIVLRATDGKGLTQDANLVINVTANPAPTLGNYANQTIVTSCKLFVTPDAIPADNQPLASVTATSPTFTGTLSVDPATGQVTAPNSGPIAGSPHTVTVTATDSCGLTSMKTFTVTVTAAPTATADFDFDGDRKADLAVYRDGATSSDQSFWFVLRSSDLTVQAPQFGVGGDRVVTADYNGDGTANFSVFRPSTGVWYTSLNAGTNYDAFAWGTTGDIPVPGRYDADAKADHAVFRPVTGQWWIFRSTGGTIVRNWGVSTDLPVPADYDGDGITDIAVYRPSTLSFHILRSTAGSLVQPFGTTGDKLVPADYDGDGKDDIAVWRPSTGFWFVLQSGNGQIRHERWGLNGDVPVPADYDNDGKADLAIFRPSDGRWWIFSSCPCVTVGLQWGIATDKPVPSAFTP
ncbi:MAG: Ig-like domain repeat protein [Acidobacteriota bacterium]